MAPRGQPTVVAGVGARPKEMLGGRLTTSLLQQKVAEVELTVIWIFELAQVDSPKRSDR